MKLNSTILVVFLVALFLQAAGQTGVSFTTSTLGGGLNLSNPTVLGFGPDNRLYVTQQDGFIFAYTVQKNGPNNYVVTNTETISLVRNIANHNDKGGLFTGFVQRQVTGMVITGTAANPVLYICSSDPRIGGGGELGDINLDTNSGIISKLTKNGSTWNMVHLVRGLPRCEENHSPNGLSLDVANNILYVAQGGNTNAGSPSNNFGFLAEYALSGAILSIDIDMINQQFGGSYTLPTLDDPTRANLPDGTDVNDPFGGNDGLNQAKLVIGGPVQIYAPGFRLSYDLLVTKTPGKSGRMYTIGNGGNAGWGGYPENEGTPNVTNNRLLSEPGSTAPTLNDDKVNNRDGLHFVRGPGYYAGHPNPIRANPAGAGWYWFDNDTGLGHFEMNPTVDWPPYPVSMANPIESDYRNPGVNDGSLYTWGHSTNGLAEYTSTAFFNGAMAGNLLAACWDGGIHRIELNEAGDAVTRVTKMFAGFGDTPLDVIAQGDGQIFPGTIWSVVYGGNGVTVFEPVGTPVNCTGNNTSFTLDDDGDGYSNGDETANGTDPCSAASKPNDFDLDLVSDMTDPDDDNDGLNDIQDKFALDANNGKNTQLPLDYPFLNGNPGFGLFGIGQTGVMTNYVNSYETQYDLQDPALIAGGAVGALSVPAQPGDAVTNNQMYAFQFGIPVSQSTSTFTLESRLLGSPFFNGATGAQLGTQSVGIYFGNGDQDNYLKFVLHANNGNPGFQILCEQNGSVVHQQMIPIANILSTSQIDLFIEVNATTGLVKCRYQNSGTPSPVQVGQDFTVSGSLLNLLLAHNDAVAVGLISSCGNKVPFSASWDYMKVTTSSAVSNVIRINAGGTAQNFNGQIWVADQYFTGGSVYSVASPIANTTQDQIYQTERFGNFQYAIPVTGAGTYAVDLHLCEVYFTTAGSRVFNINIENGQFVRNSLDLIQTYGPNLTAIVLRADNLNVTDGFINISFTSVVDNAKISGISVDRYGTPPANSPPVVANPIADQTATVSQAFSFTVPSNAFSDPDAGTTLTYSASLSNGNPLPLWLSFNPATRAFTGTPASGDTGILQVRVTASDGALTANDIFSLTVNAPAFTNFYRALNLNGAALTIDGNSWQASTGAANFSFSQSGGGVFANQNVPLVPSTDANRSTMIRSSIWGNTVNVNVTAVPNGSYDVYVYVWEDNFTQTFSVSLEGTVVVPAYNSGSAGVWSKLGPFRANITDGAINVSTNGGHACVSGIEIWSATAPTNPVVIQPYPDQSLINTQTSLVVQLGQIFNDDGGVNNLTFTVPNNTNAALISNTQITGTQLTFTLSGTIGTGLITLRATDANNQFVEDTFQLTVAANTAPVVTQAYPDQSVVSTQTTLVVPLNQIFNDDGGVNNLTFSVPNNTNAALISNTQIAGTQLTFTLSGTTGSGNITLRATDANNLSVDDVFQLTVTTAPQVTNLIRINSGGPAQNFGGQVWVADQYFTGGSVYSVASPIANTTQDQVYQTERFGNFQYAIPVTGAGTYAVDLHLCEIYFTAAGGRVFNINIENGQFVRNNLDLIQTYGPNLTAIVLRADNLNITDGFININFTSVVDNAKISGISVDRYGAPPANSPPVVANPIADQTANVNQAFNFTVPSNAFSDPDAGTTLTYSASLSNGNPLPLWLSFNPTTRAFTGTPASGDTGVLQVRVTASDGAFTANDIFALTVNAPAFTNFYRALNLNGAALTIDGNSWQASTGAANFSFSQSGGGVFANQNVPLVPSTDANRSTMIRSSIWGNTVNVNVTAVPNGSYDVYVYVWEDNFTQTFSVSLEGTVVVPAYNSGSAGVWSKLGPFRANITDGAINVSTNGGHACVSGIEIWSATAPTNPVVIQPYPDQSLINTQTSLVVQLGQIFNDDGGVNNLTFTVPNNTNAALIGNTQIAGTQLTFTLSGTTGTGLITLRATDAGSQFVEDVFQLTVTDGSTPQLVNVVRINSGGPAQNFGGEAWVADQYFTGGSLFSTTSPIANTTQDQIYQTERWGTFQYAIPVSSAGTYAVDFHLAEIYFNTAGSRVFNINVENGQFVRNNLDLVQTYGPNLTAIVLRADNLNITDGFINISFTSVVDNAKVSGIAVGRYTTGTGSRQAIAGHAPVVKAPNDVTIYEGQAWNYQVEASDPDGDKLTYSTKNLPASLYIDKATGLIKGTIEVNANVFPVTLTVTDASGLSTDVKFVVTIAARPVLPEIEEQQFVVFPNPTEKNEFSVRVDVKKRDRWNFTLVEFTGRQIELGSFVFENGLQEVNFDLTPYNLGSGLYYLSVQNSVGKKVIKVGIKL